MLGLENTVSSGSTLESLYSLTFDGTDDHINLGDNLDLGTDNFTISLWAKFADATHGGTVAYFLAKNQDSNNRVRLFLSTGGKIQVRIDGDGSSVINKVGDTAVTALEDTWVHICVSCARDGNLLLYVNGSTSTYGFSHDVSSSSSVDLDNTGPWIIGAISVDSNFFNGKIDEVSIWGAALDSGSVGSLYNQGSAIDVASGTSIDSTYLKGYWRMGNGLFDDKANGVIHDQHNPGFGAEALTNGDFETDGDITADSWSLGWAGLSDAGAAEGVTIEGGLLVMNNDGTVNDGRVYATNGSSSQNVVTSGKIDKLTYTIVEILGESVAMKYHTGAATVDLTNEQETVGTHTIYYRAAGTVFILYQLTSGSTVKLSEVSLKPLNGFPGLTSGGPTFISDTP